jgi:DNA-binding MarR family transcriptional regulator
MDLPIRYQFVPRALGGSIYREDGEPYLQLPRSVSGKLSRRAHLVIDAIIEFACPTHGVQAEATDARDRDIEDKTGLKNRTVQRALQDLEEAGVELIRRIRSGGRRVIEIAKHLLESRPKPETQSPAPTAGKKKTLPHGEPDVDKTRAAQVRVTLGAAEAHGKVPQLVDGALQWVPIPGAPQRDFAVQLQSRIDRFEPDIRALLEQTRPKRE